MKVATGKSIDRAKLSNLLSEKRNGVSVREFIREYQEFGIAPHAWRSWESGETKPSTENLIKLAKLFNLPLEDFVNLVELKEGEEKTEFKFPIRSYSKKTKVYTSGKASQPNIIGLLTEDEKAMIAFRLVSELHDKKQLLLNLIKEVEFDLIDLFKELAEENDEEDPLFLIKKILRGFNLEKEQKINLATFLLTDATLAE